MTNYQALNRAWWDQAAGIHATSPLYDLEAFIAGENSLRPFEADDLGDVSGLDMVHLQCHIGTDTLSWARLGACVTGYDFSEKSLEVARNLASRLALDASFVTGDLYDASNILRGRTFDIVYTGIGALTWLPDMSRWAEVVASLLKPGGRLYLVEFHPLLNIIKSDTVALDASWPYFHHDEGMAFTDAYDYSGSDQVPSEMTTMEWSHDLGSIFTAILKAGLVIEQFREYGEISYQRWPGLEQVGASKRWRIPQGQPQIPLEFSLIARNK